MKQIWTVRIKKFLLTKRRLVLSSILPTLFALLILFQNCSGAGFGSSNGSSTSGTQSSSASNPSSGSGLSSIELGWDPDTDAGVAGYKIYYGTTSGSKAQSLDVGLLTPVNGVVSYIVPQLTTGQTYFFSIIAYDSNKVESPNSNEVSQLIQ